MVAKARLVPITPFIVGSALASTASVSRRIASKSQYLARAGCQSLVAFKLRSSACCCLSISSERHCSKPPSGSRSLVGLSRRNGGRNGEKALRCNSRPRPAPSPIAGGPAQQRPHAGLASASMPRLSASATKASVSWRQVSGSTA